MHASVDDYVLSTETGTPPATAAHLQVEADQELRAALPLAAAANSDDGSWNSLMTTISEGAIVDEGHLIPALRAQCVVADTNPDVNPQGPGNSGNSATPAPRAGPRPRAGPEGPPPPSPRTSTPSRPHPPGRVPWSWPANWARPAVTMVGINDGATRHPLGG